MNTTKRLLYVVLGPLVFVLISLLLNGTFGTSGAQAIGVLVWMIVWWVLQPIHIAATALVPIIANGLFNIVPMGSITSQYWSDSILLILGSSLLTIPWKKTGLDRRIALNVLSIIGPSMKSQITVWLLASMAMSIALPNVAVCALLTPIAISMLNAAGYEDIPSAAPAVPILLCIGWGVGLGGVGSPLGGAMNVAAISFIEDLTGKEFMYIDWVLRIAPFLIISAAVMLTCLLFVNRKTEPINGTKEYFTKSRRELGKMKRDEIICATLFVVAMIGAFARPLYAGILPALAPAYVFLTLGFLTFLITAADKGVITTWETAQKELMWGMMVLFGGGLALGKLINESGANTVIAGIVSSMELDGGLTTIIIIAVASCILSETINSTASAAIVVPIVLAFTTELGLNPIPYWFITIMAYNAEFLLPVSVRAIPVSYGLDPKKMMQLGFPLMLIRLVVVVGLGYAMMQLWPAFSNIPNLV